MNYEQTKRFLLTSLRRADASNDLEKAKAAILADLKELHIKKQKPEQPSAAAAAAAAAASTPAPATAAAGGASTDQDVKDILDYALQVVLAEVCQRHDKGEGSGGGSKMDVEEGTPAATSRKYEDVGLLIDIALWLGREKMIESAAPLELVRDFFLSHTIEECQQFFALLEDRADQLSRAIIGDTRANNTLLRALSEVRKRLSRTNDLVFAGRILMFMAYAFPLSDKSGVNLKGEANVANVTTMDKEPSPALEETPEDKSEPPVDWTFYQMFWGLQSYFLNPIKAFEAWPVVAGHLHSVLDLFKQYPISEEEASAASYSYANPPAASECYLTKYLTSSRLLRLQLRDPWFRRHIMVQFLVFFQSLRVVSESSTVAQKLTEQQKNEIAGLTKKTKTSLWETPPNGMHFTNTIYAILKRENNWTDWKKEGCPPFEKPPVAPLEPAAVRAAREVRFNKKKKGLAALLEGESVRDLQALLQKEERGRMVSLEEWLEPVIEEMDPEAAIEAQYKKINTDKIYVWRAKRLTFKHSLEYFCTLAKQDATLEDVAKQLLANNKGTSTEDGMVLEDREEKRDADVDEEDKESVVKIEAKHGAEDQEEGQLVGEPDSRDEDRPEVKKSEKETDSKLPMTTTTTLEAGEVPTPQVDDNDDEKKSEVGEKRKEMPTSPLKTRDDASPPAVKKRRVANSPLLVTTSSPHSGEAKSTTTQPDE